MKFQEHQAAYREALSSLHNGQLSRREALRKMGAGFGTLGLAGVLQQAGLKASLPSISHTVQPSLQVSCKLLIMTVAEDYL